MLFVVSDRKDRRQNSRLHLLLLLPAEAFNFIVLLLLTRHRLICTSIYTLKHTQAGDAAIGRPVSLVA